MTTRHLYPARAMVGDYLRAAVGFVPSAALLATVPLGRAATIVLGGFALVFGLFGVKTLLRHFTRIEVGEAGMCARGWRAAEIPWAALDRMTLAYYSTRRDGSDGWMQLELGAGGARLGLDSRIDGFAALVERAAAAAAARGLVLGAATQGNLQALGIALRSSAAAAAPDRAYPARAAS